MEDGHEPGVEGNGGSQRIDQRPQLLRAVDLGDEPPLEVLPLGRALLDDINAVDRVRDRVRKAERSATAGRRPRSG